MVIVAVFLVAPSAFSHAYDYYLTDWNVTELNTSVDKTHVQINGTQGTLTWLGKGLRSTASSFESIWYTFDIRPNSRSGLAAGYTTTDPCAAVTGGDLNGGLCTADGFGVQILRAPGNRQRQVGQSRRTVVG